MKLCLAALALILLAPQSNRAPISDSAHEIVVEVGRVPMNGVWLQDAGKHLHDHDVVLDHITRPDGSVEVTLGSGVRSSWSTLTLTFTHDGSGATKVAAITKSRPDVHRDGLLPAREEQALDGRVLVHTNDWGPGKDISCMFALNGMSGKQPMLLMGSFLVMLPK